ncbi:acetylcholine receptor subunit alpha-like [Saccostrea cucullata]|uniref:acetylcholine receptor subunit alpha-like n=1 Tax=Saccostrea cuccullata TaxID=36930 RepID=UPI002ED479B9
MERVLWFLLFNHCFVTFVCGYTLTDEQNLHTALLTGYNKDIRPGTDRSNTLVINASFLLLSINEFDLNAGKLSLTGVFAISWFEERFAWNPATYNALEMTAIPQTKLWLPNFINTNPYEDIRGLGSDLLTVDVFYTGKCTWFPLQAYKVICDADVTNFPFDTQKCFMKFFIFGYQPNAVNVKFTSPRVDFDLYSENGIWEILNSETYSVLNIYGLEDIFVVLHLKRRTAYYIVSLILPISAFSLLMGFVFLLPNESGERLGFSTTVLLSIVVYLTIIQDMLPAVSEPNVSILSYMLVTYVVSGALVVVFVIISSRIQSCPHEKPVPRCLARLVICFRKKRTEIDVVENLQTKSEMTDDYDVSWTDVGRVFDMTCFILSAVQFIVASVTYFLLVAK